MKLKPIINRIEEKQEEPKKKGKKKNTLPPDEYKSMFPPRRFMVRETPSRKDPSGTIKKYLEITVRRINDDIAEPCVWIQMYQESSSYTGYLSGHTVFLPVDCLFDLIEALGEVDEECEKEGI